MSDSEYEYEEETNYVLFDIGASVTSQYIEQISQTQGGCRIIGLEEGKPYLQVGHQIFEGEMDDTIGTNLLFEIQESKRETTGLLPLLSSMKNDGSKQPKYTTNYFCKSEKIVTCTSVTLRAKDDEFEKMNAKAKADAQQRAVDDEENDFI
ncbi:hypothetical protein G6F57_005097 [Rhizopus arrhizus]|uniref:Transcription factor TFIIIC triple barrel domain-containing protein n=1 Tax=Rhizopus oryzae TaxID=64495 RepID=A0A9P7BTS6_RHIOR|nr:hypothetical protein G6F23_009482 [Rhizopus arrhizus]KAG1425942.1 hypothetical protein G6F58_001698 [Rhizopus delemar]KAG0765744.1 hypothetical protein G6F24_004169 [Rhizopus arrhizus]KAG0791708.1 hypothetical protein G6F21_004881 [Rhizopus arrhizus]KAG0799936.1 hypothetical protein G6F22_002730 [Rhizopus arrhizus]